MASVWKHPMLLWVNYIANVSSCFVLLVKEKTPGSERGKWYSPRRRSIWQFTNLRWIQRCCHETSMVFAQRNKVSSIAASPSLSKRWARMELHDQKEKSMFSIRTESARNIWCVSRTADNFKPQESSEYKTTEFIVTQLARRNPIIVEGVGLSTKFITFFLSHIRWTSTKARGCWRAHSISITTSKITTLQLSAVGKNKLVMRF